MNYELHYTRKAVRYLRKLQPARQRKVFTAMERIRTTLTDGMDIKAMKGLYRTCRLRLGNLRVVYAKHDDLLVVKVIDINTRGDTYHGNWGQLI